MKTKEILGYTLTKPETINGSLNLMIAGWLNTKHTLQLLSVIDRAERRENPIVYCKAIRATLLGLGFDSDWVENEFREVLEDYFIYNE